MYTNLIGVRIDKNNEDFKDFPSALEGDIYLSGDKDSGWDVQSFRTSQEIIDEAKELEKAEKQVILASITVTTSNGNMFDGDDVARADMLSAIEGASFLGLTEKEWKLADNSWKLIQLSELREASALAIIAKGQILAG